MRWYDRIHANKVSVGVGSTIRIGQRIEQFTHGDQVEHLSNYKIGESEDAAAATQSWGCSRMRIRYDHLKVIWEAWNAQAASVICFRI
jgi:hypothetical protein